MIDRIKALREHAAVIAILVVLVGIAVTTGRIAADLRIFPLPQVLRGVSGLYGLVDALVLTVLALACVLVNPPTRHATQLTLAATVLLWLGAVVGLLFLAVSLFGAAEGSLSRILESVGGLTDVALRALMGYALLLGYRVAVAAPAASMPAPLEEAVARTDEPPAGEVPQEGHPSLPVWRPDEATGVVWRSAADAARGVAAGTYDAMAPRPGPPVWDPAADVTRKDSDAGQDDQKPPP